MINKLDERLKKYSHKYFVKEFMKYKPNTEYKKLKKKGVWLVAGFCILIIMLTVSVICRCYLGDCWYLCSLCLLICLFVLAFWSRDVECYRMKVLAGMAAAYLDTHEDLKKRIQDYALLTTWKGRMQYIYAIRNTYRADIVKQCLGNDYNICTLKALKDEISIKGVKFDLGFISFCSLFALSIAIADWLSPYTQNKWPIAIGVLFFLVLFYFLGHGARLVARDFKCKKYKILRETLTFMLYNYM